MTTRELRQSFWEAHPQYRQRRGWDQNDYPTDVRVAWCDYVDAMARSGSITERVASNATLAPEKRRSA